MKVNGAKIKLTAKAHMNIGMVPSTTEIGKKIDLMGSVLKLGQVVPSSKDTTSKVRK